jgi:hypothetical protein
MFLARAIVDRLLVDRFSLVRGALAFVQSVGWVEARLWRIAVLGWLAGTRS